MAERVETESRKLLGRLRDAMAGDDPGQARLDKITHLIADSIGTEVCSIYLFRDEETLELCATEGLNPESCLLYTSPSPRDQRGSRMPSSA